MQLFPSQKFGDWKIIATFVPDNMLTWHRCNALIGMP